MMEALGQYALRLITGALICGTVLSLVREKSHGKLVRILCGILLMQLLLDPGVDGKWKFDTSFLRDAALRGEDLAASGQDLAEEMQRQRMEEGLQAYIWDKAAALGADLAIEIEVSEDLVPVGAEFRGEADAGTKDTLSELVERELGIAKENQRWTG